METLKAIKTRRSVRRFLNKDIPKDILKKVILAGEYAPSSKDTRPWHFLIFKGKKKNEIIELVKKEFSKKREIYRKGKKTKSSTLASCKIVESAPILILVFNKAPYTRGEKNVIKDNHPEALLAWNVEIQSVSAAIQNMLLATHDFGLGGVWLADFNFCREEICKYIQCDYDLVAGIALGYPSYSPPRKNVSFKKLEIIE